MRTHQLFASAALLVFLASGCTSYSFGHRDTETDPDVRLAKLVDEYDQAKAGQSTREGQILRDTSRIQLETERLALDIPGHVPTLMACAVMAFEAKETVKAQRYLDAIFHDQPAHAEAAILRSRIAIDEGNLPFARRLLATQVQYAPDNASLREAHSGVLYMSHDLEGARAEILAAEKLGAPAWRVAYNRGLIAEAAGQNEEAQRQYQAAVDGNADFPQARSRLSGMKAIPGYNPTAPLPGTTKGG
jgi:tetratricopeptide (TPR) repeat protein